MRVRIATALGLVVAAGACASLLAAGHRQEGDSHQSLADGYVAESAKYLHHTRLKRGMKGFGKTVLAGGKIERFDLEIVSVVRRWGPHRDVILARISSDTYDFTKSGIIAGMSGSPCYVRDPRDGKLKMIGALAYGWSLTTEPICGIQPISQMLAMTGVLPGNRPQGRRDPNDPSAEDVGAGTRASDLTCDQYVRRILAPGVPTLPWEAVDRPGGGDLDRRAGAPGGGLEGAGRPTLRPLMTPLMITGASKRVLSRAGRALAPLGMVPFQAGAAGGEAMDDEAAAKIAIEPGSSVSVMLVDGDMDWYAVGTVTDVRDKLVLAFGHAFDGVGDTRFPMGTAYVHTVIPNLMSSFKLTSTIKPVGAMVRDERVGIAGKLGAKAPMIPMTVSARQESDTRRNEYGYRLVRHYWITGALASTLADASVFAWRMLPENHIIEHKVTVDYGPFGTYASEDLTCNADTYPLMGDVFRVVSAMSDNPFAKPRYPERIEVEVRVREGNILARIRKLELAGAIYRPGETVKGQLTIERHRKPRTTIPVSFELPAELPEGSYTLQATDATTAMRLDQGDRPYRYYVKDDRDLFQAVKAMTWTRSDRLYLRLPLAEGGASVARAPLPDLPASRGSVLRQARPLDLQTFRKTLVRSRKGPYVFSGAASASFTVREDPQRELLRTEK